MLPLLEKTEVARQLCVSIRTVDRLRAAGDLPAIQVRGRVRFCVEDVQAFVAARRQGDQS